MNYEESLKYHRQRRVVSEVIRYIDIEDGDAAKTEKVKAHLLETLEIGGEVTAFLPILPEVGLREAFLKTPDDIEQFLEDHIAFAAKVEGVSRDEYAAWLDTEGFVQCDARTSRGRQCRNRVVGYKDTDVRQFAAVLRSGGYCQVHGEDQQGRS